ncbi:tumor protein D52 isoform X2 [Photinus pyralis]|uniref:tumor protein D52 isoform X2 n=1 Tax=Photinus pyralis TaxID=7054 RepID=UPI0012670840|nr:tumor protein D52 isoform X2 [Photinus pyralis]
MSNEEEHSLEYIEDPYFNPNDSTSTPSLDELSDCGDHEYDLFDLRQLDFDDLNGNLLNDESVNVETEFFNATRANAIIRTFFKRAFQRQVRVTYCDLTKPYLVKLPKEGNFRKYLDISVSEEAMIAEGVAQDVSHLSFEEQEHQRSIWRAELAQVEDEIATLRTVLASKMKRSAELKRNLGITVWKEISDDMNQGIKNVKESNVYQKTSSVIGGITGSISNKLGQMRHSDSFKSIEERVGSAYENVKTKVSSRSSSIQNLDDAGRSRSGSVATTPIAEDKPLA